MATVVEPLADVGVERVEAGDLAAGEEVFFHVRHGIFNPTFFLRLAHAAGDDLGAVVIGQFLVARVEQRRLAEGVPQHGALEIINHCFGRGPAKVVEGVDVAVQKVLHSLGRRELHVEHAAVTQDYDEEAEPAARAPDGDRTELAPVYLSALPRREGEREEGGLAGRPHFADVLLDDADAAGVAGLAQLLEDLGRGIGMGLELADDLALEVVQFALARGGPARAEPGLA